MRMNADRRINALVLFSDLNRSLKCATMRIARSDIQDRTDSSLPRPLNHFLAVSVILITVNMCVGINKHLEKQESGVRSQESGEKKICCSGFRLLILASGS